jgi:hypothetical protein
MVTEAKRALQASKRAGRACGLGPWLAAVRRAWAAVVCQDARSMDHQHARAGLPAWWACHQGAAQNRPARVRG